MYEALVVRLGTEADAEREAAAAAAAAAAAGEAPSARAEMRWQAACRHAQAPSSLHGGGALAATTSTATTSTALPRAHTYISEDSFGLPKPFPGHALPVRAPQPPAAALRLSRSIRRGSSDAGGPGDSEELDI